MPARIESVGTARAGRLAGRGSRALAARAGRQALERASVAPDGIGVLVNTGIYRDDHMGEPAMAPFVQRRLGILPSLEAAGERTSFAFDLANGACGFLQGIEVAAGFVEEGAVERALVVTSDVNATPRMSEGVDLVPLGGAVVLAPAPEGAGLVAFEQRTYPKHAHLLEVTKDWTGRRSRIGRNTHGLFVRRAPGFPERALDAAEETVGALLARAELTAADLDLLVASPSPEGFAEGLAARLGLASDRAVRSTPGLAHAHTAGLAWMLDRAVTDGRWRRARHALLVTVGSGLTVAAALHRAPPAEAA